MRKFAMTAAGIAAAVVGTGVAMTGSASAATTSTMGTATACPSGAVCIRELNGTIYSKNIFYSYGAHNLSNVIGNKIIVNNQTGGAGFRFCYGYNGSSGCSIVMRGVGASAPYNMTPINSVVLVR